MCNLFKHFWKVWKDVDGSIVAFQAPDILVENWYYIRQFHSRWELWKIINNGPIGQNQELKWTLEKDYIRSIKYGPDMHYLLKLVK